eukprot:1159255-Pelagomonas_calceolata.AAC.6
MQNLTRVQRRAKPRACRESTTCACSTHPVYDAAAVQVLQALRNIPCCTQQPPVTGAHAAHGAATAAATLAAAAASNPTHPCLCGPTAPIGAATSCHRSSLSCHSASDAAVGATAEGATCRGHSADSVSI